MKLKHHIDSNISGISNFSSLEGLSILRREAFIPHHAKFYTLTIKGDNFHVESRDCD